MKRFLIVLFIVAAGFNAFSQNNSTMPEIILKDVNGKNKNMADYSKNGKITIITFWATWCTPCKKELVNINDLLEDWKNKYDVVLVAVSTDDARNKVKIKPYVDAQGWDFDVISDENSNLLRAVNGTNIPFTILLNQHGEIIDRHLSYVEGDEFILEEKIKKLVAQK